MQVIVATFSDFIHTGCGSKFVLKVKYISSIVCSMLTSYFILVLFYFLCNVFCAEL